MARREIAVGLVVALLAAVSHAGPPPPPPRAYSSPRPPAHDPPPVAVVVPAPPPLPLALRIVYAPFYAAGLVLRYGVHYLILAPLEVFGRTVAYGVEGGVEEPADAP